MRTALEGPHGPTTTITWVVAGVVAALALVHLLRPGPRRRSWSRGPAVGLPLAVVVLLVVGSIAPALHGGPFDVAMLLRMTSFWAAVALAPFAVGQVVGLRPPRWLSLTHAGLAGTFLVLLVTTDLAFADTDGYQPAIQFGPLAVPLLFPAGALAGWWLWSCIEQIPSRWGQMLFALGASVSSIALVGAGLVIDPAVADHLLVVGLLPLLAVTQVVDAQQTWRDRRRPAIAGRGQITAQ